MGRLRDIIASVIQHKVEEGIDNAIYKMNRDTYETRISKGKCTINGKRLKELREQNGYSQEELADKIYCTKYIIQGWEEGWGIINPSSGEIDEMAMLFGLSEEELREQIDADEEKDYDYEED